jgi:N-ethylmaleimide reductase
MNSLFKVYKKFNLRNRFVMAPMTRCMCDNNGIPTKQLENYYLKRAKSDFGLIIIESAAVNPCDAMGYVKGLQFHNNKHLEYWKSLVKRIKKNNTKVIIQLFHAGRLTVEQISQKKPLSSSSLSPFNQHSFWRPRLKNNIVHFQTKTKFKKPKQISISEANIIIKQFENSCKYAVQAGFDGVEIHGAHGYLIHNFNTKETNKRKDKFKAQNFKFSSDLIKRCKKIIKNKILSYRLSLHMIDNTYIKYSNKDYNIAKLVKKLDKYGVNIFHCSELKAGSKLFNSNKSLIEIVRSVTKKTVISCGNILDEEQIKKIFSSGANLVAFGRLSMMYPNLVLKFKKNQKLKKKFTYDKWKKYY